MSRPTLVCIVSLVAAQLGAAQESFKGKTLESVPFDKRTFKKGADFSETTLTKCNFSEAKLVEADFRKATITGGYFLWADLTKADFRGAKLTKDIGFGGAILDGANLEGLDLSECGFNVNKFRGANLRNLKGIKAASRCDFSEADLRGADLSGMKWVASDAQPKFTNARYDSKTIWPAAIDPTTVGAKLVKDEDTPKENPTLPKVKETPKSDAKPNAQDKALEELRGPWKVAKSSSPDFAPKEVVIDGTNFTVVFDDDAKLTTDLTIKIDPTTKPMQIDLIGKDRTWPGIYEFSGDTLRICFALGAKRPTEFKTGAEAILVTLKPAELDVRLADGKFELKAGFAPDPHKVEKVGIGGPEKTRLGGISTRVGVHTAVTYTAGKDPLTFSVVCAKDTTLLIRLPDGTWVADDNSGGGINPLIRIAKPESGTYEVYVGLPSSTPKDVYGFATLFITGKEVKPVGGNPTKKDTDAPMVGAKENPLEITGTYWRLLSLTGKGEKITDADNPADVEFTKDGKWGILHYGGMREAGTYKVKDGHLVMTGEDGVPYFNAKMTSKPESELLELDDGKLLMRLKRVKPK
ncbi:MAG: pentapeptide repeat-containing protein [Planctomycetes bacterium]|nr:pentapeptide repeat-containing protein [Planctomycetota bacterium]